MFPRLDEEPELGCCILIVEDQIKSKRKDDRCERRRRVRNKKSEEREREVKEKVCEEEEQTDYK